MKIQIKKVIKKPGEPDGFRVLTERLWPRGVSKQRVALDRWMKGVAPSHELRKWFGHDSDKLLEFKERYRRELFGSEAVEEMIELIKQHKTVTLIYASKDKKHNSTMVLQEFLEDLLIK